MVETPGGPDRAVGRAVPRREDFALLTGAGCFVDDLAPDGTLEAVFLRSPLAHARIESLDVAPALAVPGVEAVWAAHDLGLPPLVSPCEWPDSYSPPRPLLAEGVVRFVGEAIAVVVARSRYAGEDALELIELDLDPLEPVPDVASALAANAPSVHEGRANLYLESRFEAGDVDGAFAGATGVVERSFRHARVNASPIEPRGALAVPTRDGVQLWSSTQVPHKLQLAVSEALGLEREQVQVLCPDVGGGFGQKAHVHPEEIVVAAIARRLGRPVRWIEDRVENLACS
jgi:carbon-monoxide dehydrogenase large subunit